MTRSTAPALCAHGYEAALCRDEQTPEVRAAVDFVYGHAYAYAVARVETSTFPTRDECEAFAAWVAADCARREGDLSGDLNRDAERWLLSR